ncbi:MAG: sugar ABC transporter permease YjfF [Treponema sp.]|jgi:simple sugar transport system permease protein|nr:sugar ABC transporter permease YjfF [Treponema sp.]MBQ1643142.1 sugar ABC transporter permease YjfF [Treponema sp.]MBQ1671321.1 sugar ABC transporter permease YjfF [Treponema sp.]MBQ1714228.1 sugar ABC transporter permease YjfF [Treponema sp.]MBQ2206004.1 sugar ABC transporter permease YjfF [Treponema sp.]
MSGITGFFKKKFKQPVSNTALLLTITICTFVVMYILAMAVWGGGFLNPQQFFNIFNNNAYLIIIACGLTIVMISGGIDISVGGQVALITMTTVCFLENRGGSVFGALVIALAIGLAFGAVQGFLISYLKIQPFIVTLAGMFFAKGMTTIVSVNPVTVKANEFFLKLKEFTINIPGIGQHTRSGMFINSYLEIGAVVAILAVVILWAALKWTRIGRNFYAIGGNSESALMLGINVQRTRFLAYLICGLLAGIAGFVYLLHTGAGNASNADGAEMEAIASSIIGGTLLTGGVGSLIGTLFGVMSLKTITTIVITSGLTQPWWQKITTGLMLCFFILLQSVILSARKKKLGTAAQ